MCQGSSESDQVPSIFLFSSNKFVLRVDGSTVGHQVIAMAHNAKPGYIWIENSDDLDQLNSMKPVDRDPY